MLKLVTMFDRIDTAEMLFDIMSLATARKFIITKKSVKILLHDKFKKRTNDILNKVIVPIKPTELFGLIDIGVINESMSDAEIVKLIQCYASNTEEVYHDIDTLIKMVIVAMREKNIRLVFKNYTRYGNALYEKFSFAEQKEKHVVDNEYINRLIGYAFKFDCIDFLESLSNIDSYQTAILIKAISEDRLDIFARISEIVGVSIDFYDLTINKRNILYARTLRKFKATSRISFQCAQTFAFFNDVENLRKYIAFVDEDLYGYSCAEYAIIGESIDALKYIIKHSSEKYNESMHIDELRCMLRFAMRINSTESAECIHEAIGKL